jgi:LysM repeat protein
MHGCTVDEILKLNPGIDINDLSIGQLITLPSMSEDQNDLSFDEEGFLLHKVKKGETLYTIAKYYMVSPKEIKSANPELGWGGPRISDIIKIPQPNSSFEELFILDSLVEENLVYEDSIAEDEFAYFYDFEDDGRQYSKKLQLAYLIPFDLKEMEPLDSLLKDVKSPIRLRRIKEDYFLEKSKPQSPNFLEFLEGSLLAIDALTNSDIELEIHVFDTKKSMYHTRLILERPEMSEMDLIIGPFYAYNLELVSAFSKENRIPLVTPFHSNDSLLKDNPYLFQPNPSYKVEYQHNAEYIGRSYNSNLIFVHNGDSSQAERLNYYKEAVFNEIKKYSSFESVLFKEVIIKDGNTEDLKHAFNPDYKNVLILPATDEAFASQVASIAYYQLDSFDIEIFGSSYWVGFDDIEISYIHALQLRISHTHWYDYHDPKFLAFLAMYRKSYIREPAFFTRKGCSFGIVGYDLSMYFLSALKKYGPRFLLHMDNFQIDQTICEFDFQRISRRGGFENNSLKYYYFANDLEVKEIELPENPLIQDIFTPANDDPIYYNWPVQQVDTTEIIDLK